MAAGGDESGGGEGATVGDSGAGGSAPVGSGGDARATAGGGSGGEGLNADVFPSDPTSMLPLFAFRMKQGPAQAERRDFELFWVAPGDEVRHLTHDLEGFRETALGEETSLPPVAISRIDGQMELFVASDDGGVAIKTFRDGEWQPGSETHAGPILESLAVASYSFEDVDVFGVDLAGTVQWLRWRADEGWAAEWEALPGVTVSGSVAVVARLQDELRLFVRSSEGELWSSVLSPLSGFAKDWAVHSACGSCPCDTLREPPVVASKDGSRIDLAFVSTDGSVWHMAWNDSKSAIWTCTSLEVGATGRTHFQMKADGVPTLFRLDQGSLLASDWSTGEPSFDAWRAQPFEASDLTSAGLNRALTHVFGRTSDGAILYRAWEAE